MLKILIFFVANSMLAVAYSKTNPPCEIPANSINWILRYCAIKSNSGDEITIQNSPCFAKASKDLSDKDECKIKLKYKKKFCLEHWMKNVEPKSTLKQCLANKSIPPFFAGG